MHNNNTSSKSPLLFLTHRMPYPPDKGEKIRAWQMLLALKRHHSIIVGAFTDEAHHLDKTTWFKQQFHPDSWVSYRSNALPYMGLSLLRALRHKKALSEACYSQAFSFKQNLEYCLSKHTIQIAWIYSSVMFQWIAPHQSRLKVIVDLVDVDSIKWAQYAQNSRFPFSWLYQREAKYTHQCEAQIAASSQHQILVSQREKQRFHQQHSNISEAQTSGFTSGIDLNLFQPKPQHPNPYPKETHPRIVFTGAMSYRPNIEAVLWFVETILPILRSYISQLQLYIVGAKPTSKIKILSRETNIHVTGYVPHTAVYLQYAHCVIAPIHTTYGTQTKLIEAMACQKAVITTPQCAQGLDGNTTNCLYLAHTSLEFAQKILHALYHKKSARRVRKMARKHCLQHYHPEKNLGRINALLQA